MARQSSVPYNDKSLQVLAEELHRVAERIKSQGEVYRREGLTEPILVDTQASVDRGLLELRKFHRSVEKKINDLLDERDHARVKNNIAKASKLPKQRKLKVTQKT